MILESHSVYPGCKRYVCDKANGYGTNNVTEWKCCIDNYSAYLCNNGLPKEDERGYMVYQSDEPECCGWMCKPGYYPGPDGKCTKG